MMKRPKEITSDYMRETLDISPATPLLRGLNDEPRMRKSPRKYQRGPKMGSKKYVCAAIERNSNPIGGIVPRLIVDFMSSVLPVWRR